MERQEPKSLIGATVGGRLTLERVLGGRWGAARFAARDLDGTRCDVTLIAASEGQSLAELVEGLQHLDSPHLAPLLATGLDETLQQVFFAQPRSRGLRLSDLLNEEAPLEPSAGAKLGAQIAAGLAALHAAGLQHGALAAEHVLLDGDGEVTVKLTAFGAGDSASADDIVALGRLLYHALTAETDTAVPLDERAPWIEAELAGVVQSALSAQRSGPDAATLAAALSRCGDGRRLSLAALTTVSSATRAKRPERSGSSVPETPNSPSDLPPVRAVASELLSTADAGTFEAAKGDRPSPRPSFAARRGLETLIGHRIDGRFELLRIIGEGGMGAVFEAEGPDGPVAIKVMRPESMADDTLRRFFREAKLAMGIDSPHVVKVMEAGTDGDLPFMVLELLSGFDLALTIAEHGALPPDVAVRIISDACQGVAAAHAQGLVHRDIKPSNLFLHQQPDGAITVKVCDFGVAKASSVITQKGTALTRTGGILGSPAYMSPEQAQDSKTVDGRTDIWSLGITLYEAVSGEGAWHECTNIGELMAALYTRPVPPIQDTAAWIEPELAMVIHRSVARDRDDRFPDASAFCEALKPFSQDDGLTIDQIAGVSDDERSAVANRAALAETEVQPRAPGPTLASRASRWRTLAVGLVAASLLGGLITWRTLGEEDITSQAAAPLPCTSSALCTERLGATAICRPDRTCQAIDGDHCVVHANQAALDSEETIWIGTMFPTASSDDYLATFGKASERAVLLAQEEFQDIAGGVPLAGSDVVRPLGVVACDDAADSKRVAESLAALGTPAIIGFGRSEDVIELSREVFIPNDVLVVPSINMSTLITTIAHPTDHRRMVWRTAGNTAHKVLAVSDLIPKLIEPEVRRRNGASATTRVKIALVSGYSASGSAYSAEFNEHLVINGRPLSESPESLREFACSRDGSNPQQNEMAARGIREMLPHVIIIASMQDAVFEHVIGPIEATWPSELDYRPLYLFLGEGAKLEQLIANTPGLAERFLGLTTPTRSPANVNFTRGYNAKYGTQFDLTESPGAQYDAFYLVAFAASAVGNREATGSRLSEAMARLVPPGEAIDVGPTNIHKVIERLARGESVDLRGAYSKLDFDLKTGESPADWAIICARVDNNKVSFLESGLTYEASTKKLLGKFACEPY